MTSARPSLDSVLALVDDQRALERRSGVLPPGARVLVDGLLIQIADRWGGVSAPWDEPRVWLRLLADSWERWHSLGAGQAVAEEPVAPARILTPAVRGDR